jgi:acetyl-CoA carboxylase carboxyl transferase subunit alpha
MLESAVYSVISPEGCASILWKDEKKAEAAAECLRITAQDLKSLGIVEKIIPEGEEMFDDIKRALAETFTRNIRLTPEQLVDARYARFRRIGVVE